MGRRGTMGWAGEAQWERHDGVCERGFVNLTERLCQLYHSKGQERGEKRGEKEREARDEREERGKTREKNTIREKAFLKEGERGERRKRREGGKRNLCRTFITEVLREEGTALQKAEERSRGERSTRDRSTRERSTSETSTREREKYKRERSTRGERDLFGNFITKVFLEEVDRFTIDGRHKDALVCPMAP